MQIFKTKIIYNFNTYVHTLEKKHFLQNMFAYIVQTNLQAKIRLFLKCLNIKYQL